MVYTPFKDRNKKERRRNWSADPFVEWNFSYTVGCNIRRSFTSLSPPVY